MPVIVPPAAARTLGDLKTRIADEMARADLAPQIALAITDAILEASTHRFWFNEVDGYTFNLTAGQATYVSADIDGLIDIDNLYLTINGNQRRKLYPISKERLDHLLDGTPPQGEPYAYARYNNDLTFYPTPQQAYAVTIDGSSVGATLANDTDSNVWTTHGERYIRSLAKRNVWAEVIRNPDEAQASDALAVRFRDELMSQTYDRVATGCMAYNG